MGKICAQDSLWISHYVKAGSMHISHTIRACPGHPSEGWISTPTSSTRYLVSFAAFRRFYISPSKPGKEKCSYLRQGQPRWKACRQSYAVGSNWSSSPSSIPSTPGCHTCAHKPPFQHSIHHPSRPSNLDTKIENSTKRLRMLHAIGGHIDYNSLHIYQQPKAFPMPLQRGAFKEDTRWTLVGCWGCWMAFDASPTCMTSFRVAWSSPPPQKNTFFLSFVASTKMQSSGAISFRNERKK